jgi:hypothetical protein
MTRKPAKRPPHDPAQYKRFLEAAKKAEASDDPKALEKALKGIAPRKDGEKGSR